MIVADRRQILVGSATRSCPRCCRASALVASGLQALVRSSVTGTRSSVDRIVVLEEIGRVHDRPHLLLEVVGLGPGPIAVPAVQIARPGAAAGIKPLSEPGLLARMAARAVVGEDLLPRSTTPASVVRYVVAAGRVLQTVRVGRP